MELNKAMAEIAALNEKGGKGTVKLSGKTYTSVSTRVEIFRKHLGLELGIETEVLFPIKGIMMICRVKDKSGFIVGTGHAYAENLAKDKSLEKLESVSIGRAMASLGLAGGEYATDAELETWGDRYEAPPPIAPNPQEVTDGFDPDTWLNERCQNLEAFAKGPKPTLANFEKRCAKIESDPLYEMATDNEKEVYLRIKPQLEKMIEEREAA